MSGQAERQADRQAAAERLRKEELAIQRGLEKQARDDLATATRLIPKLKDTEFHSFDDQLKRVASTFDWPTHILKLSEAVPDPSALTAKHKLDIKYGYMALMSLCEGHDVMNVLNDIDHGDAREVYKELHGYFYRPTAAGIHECHIAFYNMTMANTDTNIQQFMALAQRRAKALGKVTGTAITEVAIVTVMLAGLLDEFDQVKDRIQGWDTTPLVKCKKTLDDYARHHKLTTLTKAGNPNARNKTYHVQHHNSGRGKNKTPSGRFQTVKTWHQEPWLGGDNDCQQWMRYKCTFGDKCKYGHPPGQGGLAHDKTRSPWRRDSPTTSTQSRTHSTSTAPQQPLFCLCCSETGHVMAKCPLLPSMVREKPSANYNYGSHQADHVFTVSARDFAEPPAVPPTICGLVVALCTAVIATMYKSPKVVFTLFALVFLACGILVADGTPVSAPQTDAQLYYGNTAAGERPRNLEWCSDSGTNRFVTNNSDDFLPGSVKHTPTRVAVGSGSVTSPMTGDVLVRSLDHNITIKCTNVLLLPDCENKLMPATPFVRKGCTLSYFDSDKVCLTAQDDSPLFDGCEFQGLYYFRSETIRPQHQPTNAPVPQDYAFFGLPVGAIRAGASDFGRRLLETHWAYGHLNFTKLRKMLGLKKGDDPDCAACTIASSRQRALSKHTYNRSTRANHRIHVDIGFTRNSKFPFQLAVDDYTRESFLEVLDTKADALDAFQRLHRQRNNDQAPYSLAILRTDSEPLYTAQIWDKYCENQGIAREFSSRYKHGQNGVVEHRMGTIGISYRCMMILGNAPDIDTPDCLFMANVIQCNSPTKANGGWTPNEKAAGMKLPINKRLLRAPMFCLAYAHVYESERPKHGNRGIACVYLGYDPTNNAFKVKEWQSGKKYYTADVTFHPNRFPYRANPSRIIDYLHQYDDMAPHVEGKSADLGDLRPHPSRDRAPSGKAIANAQLYTTAEKPDFSSYFVHNFGDTSPTWAEAVKSRYSNDWIQARLKEQNSFKAHNVFTLVPRASAAGKKIFKPRVVLKLKLNPPSLQHPQGSIDKFKYRLTIAAYTKMLTQGVDYKEKYASTVRWNSLKVLIAIAVRFDYDIVLFDIATFFLYGELTDEVYMEQQPDWATPDKPKEDYVCRLNKSMYGLPQAPHCAQQELKKALTADNQFQPTASDDCIYVRTGVQHEKHPSDGSTGAHVDDCVAIGEPDGPGLEAVRTALKKKFKITETINPDVIVGVQVERNRLKQWLKLHQTAYGEGILAENNMTDCKGADNPMDPGTAKAMMLLPTDDVPDHKVLKAYQTLVGQFIWLLKTRPDFLFVISLLSRFLNNATQKHLDIARNQPLRFLRRTTHYGVVFSPGDGEWILSGASDSDLAGDLSSARSTLGHYLRLGDYGAVVTSCGLDRKISTSTGQAETYAMQSLIKDTVWTRAFLAELGLPVTSPTPLRTDNDGVLKQSTKTMNHTTAKHYRIAQAYIRQKVSDDTCTVLGEDTKTNETDIFTKALPASVFKRHQACIMGPQTPL